MLLGCAMACAHAADGPSTAQRCEVSDLNAVFRNPAIYAGRKFCGEALGVPQRTGITFFPPRYDYPSRLYDVAMFLSDQRAIDRLRLSQTNPFRVRLEGRIRLLDECFSAAAEQGQLECTPTRRPIILNVSRVGSALAIVETGAQSLGAPLGAASQNLETRSREIVLRGFSDRAYVELNRGMDAPVCIRGRISIDTAGVYFALQPIQAGDIIDVGFSRILLGLSNEQARRNNMVNGRRYRLCGTLRDATPFRQCDNDHCKWYQLQNAELQRGGQRPRGEDGRRFANRALGGASIENMNHDRNGDGRVAVPVVSDNQSARNPVFVNPAHYSSREIEVCGQVDGPNILESADRRQRGRTGGISISERGPLNQRFRGQACVAGRLEYMGCQTEICTDAAFDYAIRISRVIRAEGREN